MNQLKIRFAQKEESAQAVEWLNSTEGNQYDPDTLSYPTLRVLAAYNGAGPCAYLPSQTALVLESTAVKPGTSELQTAQAFRDLVKGYTLVCSSLGIKEIYFVGTSTDMVNMAQNHGFEVLNCPVLRMKL